MKIIMLSSNHLRTSSAFELQETGHVNDDEEEHWMIVTTSSHLWPPMWQCAVLV